MYTEEDLFQRLTDKQLHDLSKNKSGCAHNNSVGALSTRAAAKARAGIEQSCSQWEPEFRPLLITVNFD